MPIDDPNHSTTEIEIRHSLRRECEERAAAAVASDVTARDAHFVMAERYADRAHSLCESAPHLPMMRSGLWRNGGTAE